MKNFRSIVIQVFVLMSPVICMAQGEGNIWHFGMGGGIDFNSGNPVAINGYVHTNEGCASICDASGNLLFSTNGVQVYNAAGTTIGSGLYGNQTTTQSALIIPWPLHPNKYFVFTADYEGHSHGLCWSMVDMAQNGGLGAITNYNTQLVSPVCEKITAVKNSSGTGYWVICHKYPTNEFYAYPVTSGSVGAPVISSIGLPILNSLNTIGYLKASPNGQKLVAARDYVFNDPIEMFDFDAATGVISNYLPIPSPGEAYGVSFSCDNTKLYVSYSTTTGVNLVQYDLTVSNFQNFPYTIIQGYSPMHTSLQLAPNGKIYCAKVGQGTLAVINNPNLAGGACNYVDTAFNLAWGTYALYGLPNFIDSYFPFAGCNISIDSGMLSCSNNFTDSLYTDNGFVSYLWSTGATTQNIEVTDSGYYWVVADNGIGCTASDTTYVTLIPPLTYSIISQTDSQECVMGLTGYIDIDVSGGTAPYTYMWSNGFPAQDQYAMNAGTYNVTVTDSAGCVLVSDSITIVQVNNMFLTNNSSDFVLCNGDTNGAIDLQVWNGLSGPQYQWSNGETIQDISNLAPGAYAVTVIDSSGCVVADTFIINEPSLLNAALTFFSDTIFCNASGGTPPYQYDWSTGETTQSITNLIQILYTVTVTDEHGCIAVDSFWIVDGIATLSKINFSISPNPFSNQLTVYCEQLTGATIEISDLLGRIVFLETMKPETSNLDVSILSSAMYLLEIKNEKGERAVRKIVKVE